MKLDARDHINQIKKAKRSKSHKKLSTKILDELF